MGIRSFFSGLLRTHIKWKVIDHENYHFEASHQGNTLNVTINDFPTESIHVYTLYINGVEKFGFNRWPEKNWGDLREEFDELLKKKGYL